MLWGLQHPGRRVTGTTDGIVHTLGSQGGGRPGPFHQASSREPACPGRTETPSAADALGPRLLQPDPEEIKNSILCDRLWQKQRPCLCPVWFFLNNRTTSKMFRDCLSPHQTQREQSLPDPSQQSQEGGVACIPLSRMRTLRLGAAIL